MTTLKEEDELFGIERHTVDSVASSSRPWQPSSPLAPPGSSLVQNDDPLSTTDHSEQHSEHTGYSSSGYDSFLGHVYEETSAAAKSYPKEEDMKVDTMTGRKFYYKDDHEQKIEEDSSHVEETKIDASDVQKATDEVDTAAAPTKDDEEDTKLAEAKIATNENAPISITGTDVRLKADGEEAADQPTASEGELQAWFKEPKKSLVDVVQAEAAAEIEYSKHNLEVGFSVKGALSKPRTTDAKDEPIEASERNRIVTKEKEDSGGNKSSGDTQTLENAETSGGEQISETAEPSVCEHSSETADPSGDKKSLDTVEPSECEQKSEIAEPSECEQTSKPAQPTEVEQADSSPPPQAKERVRRTSEATLLLDREILFDDSKLSIQSFDDGSVEAKQKLQGWTNQQWIAASHKVLKFSAPVLRIMPGRYFWSSDVYEKRILAVYNNPDVILVMRLPNDVDEVRRLLPIKGGKLELSEEELHKFLVVESVADPLACKIRLSQLTTPTSISEDLMKNKSQRSLNTPSQKDVFRRRSCFDIITPTDVATVSAAFLPADSFDDIEYTSEKSLNDTHRCEDAVVAALVNAHPWGGQAWKHQVVLGTPHSYVILGNDKALKDSLEHALQLQKSRDDEAESNNKVLFIIDARDDVGKTALHYACSLRKHSAVQILVSAGADCSASQDVDGSNSLHICAKGLDEKALSIVLSATYPTRPNPNALDRFGRSPMYLAATEGNCVDGKNNIVALDLCLSALEAWGGQLTPDSRKCKGLLHPVHCASAKWNFAKLSVVLSHCNYHYPLPSLVGSDPASLSAIFHYPIHAALISFRREILLVSTEQDETIFNAEFISQEPALVKTIQTLLDHGFEPNERFEGIVGQGEAIKPLSCYFGFTPLQILALAATEAKSIDMNKQENDIKITRILRNITKVIKETAALLVKNGARINVPPPPPTRLDRPAPTGCYSLKEALEDKKTSCLQHGCREQLKLDGNDEILSLLGGADWLNTCMNSFPALGKSVNNTGAPVTGSSFLFSSAPGGSDTCSCAICWSEFGVISNRKHLCRVSCRNVCDECSRKRLVDNGTEYRVSDGQFLLAKAEAKKADAVSLANKEDEMRKQRQNVTQARKSLGLKSASSGSASSSGAEAKTKLSTKDYVTNAISGVSEAKNKVLERGDKLSSLADKTEALNQASVDFANMAKELNRSQNSWW